MTLRSIEWESCNIINRNSIVETNWRRRVFTHRWFVLFILVSCRGEARVRSTRRARSRFEARSSRAIPRYSRRYDGESFVSGKKSRTSTTLVAFARDAFERNVSVILSRGAECCRECNVRKGGASVLARNVHPRGTVTILGRRDWRARPVPVYHLNGKTVRVKKQAWEIVRRVTRRKRHK